MGLFHCSRPVGNYAIFESRDQCLQDRLQFPGLLGRVVFDISTTVADPCNRP